MKKVTRVKKQTDSIAENLNRLKEGKACTESRMQELLKLQNKIQEQIRKCKDKKEKEEIQITLDEVKSTVRMIANFVEEFETEIPRVTLAHDAISKNDIEEVKNAFRSFILSDTALSIKNVTMTLYDFDQLIMTTKKYVQIFEDEKETG